jgi:hypothetical protein
MLNVAMVNRESGWLKLAGFCENLPGKSKILSFKNPVNYMRRFDLNQDLAWAARAPGVNCRVKAMA